jgi:hypothetical protein
MSSEETSKAKVKEPKTKDAVHKQVGVVCFDGDDSAVLMITVCHSPFKAYASKDNNHVGVIKDGFFTKSNEATATISAHEEALIVRAYFGLRNLLFNIGV